MVTQNQLTQPIVKNDLVSTRHIHYILGIKKTYVDWAKQKIKVGLFGSNSRKTRTVDSENKGIKAYSKDDYMISVDTAINLLKNIRLNHEQQEKAHKLIMFFESIPQEGKKAEKPKKIIDSKSIFSSFSVQTQLALLEEAKPMLDYLHRTTPAADCITVAEFAKLHGTGEQRMFSFLRKKKVLFSTDKKKNQVYQQYIDRNIMAVVQTAYYADGKPHVYFKPVITGKGQMYLSNLWEKAQQRKLQIYV